MADPKGNLVTPVAFNPSGYPLALEVDANGYLKITQTTPGNLAVAAYGYVNSGWHKNPILYGYSDRVLLKANNTNLPAGDSFVNLTPVAAGYINVITNINWQYIGTVPTSVAVTFFYGIEQFGLYKVLSPASGVQYDRQGWWVLKEADYLALSIKGATEGDDAYIWVTGFSVKIDET